MSLTHQELLYIDQCGPPQPLLPRLPTHTIITIMTKLQAFFCVFRFTATFQKFSQLRCSLWLFCPAAKSRQNNLP